jgi:hypothetical protein
MIQHLTKIPGIRRLWLKYPVGSVDLKTEYDIWERPHYAFGIYSAAHLARSLGLKGITAIEFGVAGGNGLVAMEKVADEIGQSMGIKIAVYGFDTGEGMPKSLDYRDLPYIWEQGFYKMEPDRLRARLKYAGIVLGNIAETIPGFLEKELRYPLGFISFDLDYYSSTKEAFTIFNCGDALQLPRIYCYFDDVIEPQQACHNEYTGELCAIREYNNENYKTKIVKINYFSWTRIYPKKWNDQIYVHHNFEHDLYKNMITPKGKNIARSV